MIDRPDIFPYDAEKWKNLGGWYDILRDCLYEIVEPYHPMTVRQVFYQAVHKRYVNKEDGYGVVQRSLVDMRRKGRLSHDWIVDESRNIRGWQGINWNLEEWLEQTTEDLPNSVASGWFRNLLADHEFSIQVWVEKEALLGFFLPICQKWGVPLCPAKGYSSTSFMHTAARDLESKNRPAKIFQFGDYDPSGQNAMKVVQRDLPKLAPKTAKLGIEFHIVALKPEQITEMNLPTRPTNLNDTRAFRFGSMESVDLDAIPPNILRQMVDDTLASCFPPGALEENRRRQEAEREQIRERIRGLLKDD